MALEVWGNSDLPIMIQLVSGGLRIPTNWLRKWRLSWQMWWHKNSSLVPILGSLEEKNALCYFKAWIFQLTKFKMFLSRQHWVPCESCMKNKELVKNSEHVNFRISQVFCKWQDLNPPHCFKFWLLLRHLCFWWWQTRFLTVSSNLDNGARPTFSTKTLFALKLHTFVVLM